MQTFEFIENLPEIIIEYELSQLIRQLDENIWCTICDSLSWTTKNSETREETITSTPRKVVCLNVPDTITREQIQNIIENYVPTETP